MNAKNTGLHFVFSLLAATFTTLGHASTDLSRLTSLLDATPDGGWVKANTTSFSSAWPTGLDAVPDSSTSNPASVIRAWSSFAWDSTRGDLIIFGGGHANYSGNEVYVWDGATGIWGRGSLPSKMEQMVEHGVSNLLKRWSGRPDSNRRRPAWENAPRSCSKEDRDS